MKNHIMNYPNRCFFWKKAIPLVFWMAIGAVMHRCLSYILSQGREGQTYPRTIIQGVKLSSMAWTLVVTLKFSEKLDLDHILKEWATLALYCAEKEDFLYHYEVGIDDSNPLVIHIVERYRTKTEYINLHKNNDVFLKFRSQLKELQDSGKVAVNGFSFQESGHGFTGK